jgi:hypothetical protein
MEPMIQRGAGASVVAALVVTVIAQGCSLEPLAVPPSGTGSESTATSGAGGGGGSGGSSSSSGGNVNCLDPSASKSFFTIADPSFCVVATYDADMSGGVGLPSWGSHGGPFTFVRPAGSGSVDLVRWKLPAGATGKLSAETTHVDAMLPADTFVSEQVVDLPFFSWTAFSWAGKFPNTAGEIVMVKGSSVAKRYPINGALSIGGVASDMEHGRLFGSSLSAVADATSNKNGLYAADTCGTTANPDLLPGQDSTCKPPIAISAWGDASGPVVADRDGNVFVVMMGFSSDQEARAFAATTIARGQGPTDGAQLFKLPGFGSSLVAIAPQAGIHGVVLFQPFNPTTFEAEDVIAQTYSVSGESVKPEGAPTPFLKLAKSNTTLTLTRDDQDRLWVGAAVASGTTFVVLARH